LDVGEAVSNSSKPGFDRKIEISNIDLKFEAKASNSKVTFRIPSSDPLNGSVIVFNFKVPGILIIL
jgi:ribosomal protein S3AE